MDLKKQVIQFAVIGVVLTSSVGLLTKCTGIDEIHWYDLIDEVQRKYFPQTKLNDYIRKDDKLLKRRIQRDVDKAIDNYWKESGLKPVEVYKPRYIEETNDESLCYTDECKSLAPPMRLCAPWVDSCPKD